MLLELFTVSHDGKRLVSWRKEGEDLQALVNIGNQWINDEKRQYFHVLNITTKEVAKWNGR